MLAHLFAIIVYFISLFLHVFSLESGSISQNQSKEHKGTKILSTLQGSCWLVM